MSKDSEKEYYLRQTKLEGFGPQAQEKLKNSRVLIIGMGGLGCPVADSLASTGVGHLKLVDFDTVEEKNLHRQHLYSITDIGQNKASLAAIKLSKRNPHISSIAINELIDHQNIKKLCSQVDLVIDASDNMDTRLLSSDYCFKNKIPYISGALYAWEAYVYQFKHQSSEDPSFRDLYPNGAGNAQVESCADIGVLPVLCQTAAVKMTHKALFQLIDERKTNTEHYFEHYDLKSDKWLSYHLKTNSNNPLRKGTERKDNISVKELTDNKGQFHIIDVREPEEFKSFNIGGTNIPLDQLKSRKEELLQNETIVFICETGVRSNSALSWFRNELEDRQALHLFVGLQQLKKGSQDSNLDQ